MSPNAKYFTAEPHANLDSAGPHENIALTLAYRTAGSPAKPAVLMPSCFGGTLDDTFPFLYISDDGTPTVLGDYFVIVCGMLGASESSSPSNAHPSIRGPKFPKVSYEDNIRLQYALCKALGVSKLAAYIGFSMGGQQAYHMSILYPDFVERIVVLAGSARTSWHNWSFLEGPKAALINSVDWHDGNYTEPVVHGKRAFSRVYATWALSQAWFREKSWEKMGFSSLEEYLVEVWEGEPGATDAHDLLCMVQCWQKGDISLFGPEKGDLPKALASIKAKVLLMPSRTDMYFPPEDNAEELKYLQKGELRVIDSIWGHIAGGGESTSEDSEFIKAEISRFLTT